MNINKELGLLLDDFSEEIFKLGVHIEEAVSSLAKALINSDTRLADEIIKNQIAIKDLESEIESACLKIIATKQPTGSDLVSIITSMKISYEFRKIENHIVHIAKNILRYPGDLNVSLFSDVNKTVDTLIKMTHNTLSAYKSADTDMAYEIIKTDNKIDKLHYKTIHNILSFMTVKQKKIEESIALLFIDRFFEKIGDHLRTICELIIFNKEQEDIRADGQGTSWRKEPFL